MSLRDLAQLKLADKDGEIVELFPPEPSHIAKGIIRAQKRILAAMAQQVAAGFPVRLIVLKARRLGISTIVDLYHYHCASVLAHRHAFVCAHDSDASGELFLRGQQAHEYSGDTRRLQSHTIKAIVWKEPHGSRYTVKTAGVLTLKRGANLQYVHMSEFAFWPNQEVTFLSLMQCVPKRLGTSVVIESTANGVGDAFESKWLKCRKYEDAEKSGNWSGWVGIFLSWLDHPEEYSIPVPDGYDWSSVEPEWAEDEPILRALGATDEQLYWRREHIDEYCNGKVDQFRQEYPAWPEQAFLTSGRPAIPAEITRRHRETVETPRKARLVWDADAPNGVKAVFSESLSAPYWEIWREADKQLDYVVGGDVATGAVSSQTDETSDADYSAAMVLERGRLETVAQWVGRLEADDFGEEMVKAAFHYNEAWASPEANSVGLAVMMVFKGYKYRRLYIRERTDDYELSDITKFMGWFTTTKTRDPMIDAWISCCRAVGEEYRLTQCLLNHSERLVEEEERFVYDKKGKRVHRPGCHDDLLFAAMIALQMHIRCPRTKVIDRHGWRQPKPTVHDIRFAGGVDVGAAMLAEGGGFRRQQRVG